MTAALDVARGYAWGALLVAVAWAVLAQCGGYDHDVHADDTTPQLVLARVTWAEAGIDALHDATAIAGVARAREGAVTADALCAYSAAFRDDCSLSPTGQRRPWLAHLDADAAEPEHWPAHLSWERHRVRWLRLLEHSGAVLRGEVRSPCRGAPTHYGSIFDAHRMMQIGAVPVWCPGVRSLFWRGR